ncbi:MAG TPA: alanyl-tRNA editing protein [Thermoplasmata archaeon]|nr:alanyl-tRNA editing protein [Thermoplasmata archaeon]
MAELEYLADSDAAYVRRFQSRVRALPPGGAILESTYFYPTGGGQPADLGLLRRLDDDTAWKVTDVQRSGGTALHRLGRAPSGSAPLAAGNLVEGEIDWERRYRHMRLHTGQHLLSARLFALHQRRTRGAKFSGTGGTLELEPGPPLALAPLADDLAEWIGADRNVHITFVPRTEYERSPASRSSALALPSNVDPVRVVEIEEADRCPCGGTHVRRLGEVGPVEVTSATDLVGGSTEVAFRIASAPPRPSG